MNITRPSTATQRVLGSAVAGLFAANGLAAAVLIQGDVAPDRRPAAISEAAGVPTAELPRTVTLITTRDGRHLVADQGTPEGRKAISDARRGGGTTQTVTLPALDPPSDTSATLPGRSGGDRTLDLGAMLDNLAGGVTAGGAGTGAGSGVIEIGQQTLDKLLQETRSTVTSLVEKVGSTPSTITSIVGGAPSTITSIVGGVPSTITSIVGGVPSTITSIVGGVPSTITSVLPTIPPPVSSIFQQVPITTPTSLLSGMIATVTSVVQPVQQPTTTTITVPVTLPRPVCGLLVHC